jgi:hypothetical protein
MPIMCNKYVTTMQYLYVTVIIYEQYILKPKKPWPNLKINNRYILLPKHIKILD